MDINCSLKNNSGKLADDTITLNILDESLFVKHKNNLFSFSPMCPSKKSMHRYICVSVVKITELSAMHQISKVVHQKKFQWKTCAIAAKKKTLGRSVDPTSPTNKNNQNAHIAKTMYLYLLQMNRVWFFSASFANAMKQKHFMSIEWRRLDGIDTRNRYIHIYLLENHLFRKTHTNKFHMFARSDWEKNWAKFWRPHWNRAQIQFDK